MDKLISKLKKNASGELWIQLKDFEGKQYVDIREHFLNQDDKQWLPTKKGVMVAVPQLPELIDALDALKDVTELGTVRTISKSKSQEIQIGYREYERRRYAEIRTHYLDGEVMKPTQKGATFKLEMAPALMDALRSAEDELGS